MFDKMLNDYAEGEGSALEEANKSATNLTGSLNTLSNSWNELVNTLVNSDTLKGGVNILNDLTQAVTKFIQAASPLGALSLGAGAFAGIKNIGRDKKLTLIEYAYNNIVSYSKNKFLVLSFS